MASKTTPGEWNVSKSVNDYTIISENNGYDIATVFQYSRNIPQDEAEANAKLMAASKDLLEALIGIIVITDRNHVAWDKAHAAISKANN